MWRSLKRSTSEEARLFILCMDDATMNHFLHFPEPGVVPIALSTLERDTPELTAVKSTRTRGEYCWTCTPSLIEHCISRFNLSQCTYLDADLLFFGDPGSVFARIGGNDVLITPHRYSKKYDRSESSGIFCVQFMVFNASHNGRKILGEWKRQCIHWCFSRHENGRFGDQKYLDRWPNKYNGVFVDRSPDVGLAPWNIQQYKVGDKQGLDQIILRYKNDVVRPIFYHYHDVKIYHTGRVSLTTNYVLSRAVINNLYIPYIRSVVMCEEEISSNLPENTADRLRMNEPKGKKEWLKGILWQIRGTNNFIHLRDLE